MMPQRGLPSLGRTWATPTSSAPCPAALSPCMAGHPCRRQLRASRPAWTDPACAQHGPSGASTCRWGQADVPPSHPSGRRPLQPGRRRMACRASALSVGSMDGDDHTHTHHHHITTSPGLILQILAVLVFGVSNRVLYRIALVPMSDYVFFLAQFQNVVYLLVYFTILHLRYRAKLVTPEMLALPKGPMVLIGGCEAASQLLFMIGASHLPGVLLPLVNQTYLVWNLTFASVLLGVRYTRAQICGAFLVVVGVMTAVAPMKYFAWWTDRAALAGQVVAGKAPEAQYVLACVACFAFPALASIIKEKLFRSANKRLGRSLDIFVVNSFASLFQALFVLALLPLSLSYNRISLAGLPEYLGQGAACFQGLAPKCGAPCCDGAPLLPILYVVTNLCFNISILTMIRRVGSVTTTIVGSCLVPLTMLCFCLPLPYLERATLQPNLLLGAFALLVGLIVYNVGTLKTRTPGPTGPTDELPQP